MKKIVKRVVALAAVTAMTITTLVGCAAGSNIDNTEVVATVGEQEISAGLANFYLRYQQSSVESIYEMYLGQNYWSATTTDGTTYGEAIEDATINMLHEFYVLDSHMSEYNVTISEAELKAIDEAAEAFIAANSEEANKQMSAEKEYVAELLRLFTVNANMFEALTADVDRNVTQADAAQKRLRYYSVSKSATESKKTDELTEDELADLEKMAEDFLAGVKANGDMKAYAEGLELTTQQLTFDAESESIASEVIKVADQLKEGEFSDVIETDSFFYVIQLESEFDEEATAKEIDNIISTRETEAYTAVVQDWLDATPLEINEKVWDKISVEAIKIIDASAAAE